MCAVACVAQLCPPKDQSTCAEAKGEKKCYKKGTIMNTPEQTEAKFSIYSCDNEKLEKNKALQCDAEDLRSLCYPKIL